MLQTDTDAALANLNTVYPTSYAMGRSAHNHWGCDNTQPDAGSVLAYSTRHPDEGLMSVRSPLRAIFGSLRWQPPLWAEGALRGLATRSAALQAATRARPQLASGVTAGAVALALAALFGWRWYQAQPKPQTVDYTITAPAITCYACETPRNQPNPLRISFAGSVAPLERAGKPLDANKMGVSLAPAFTGTWRWLDDRVLQFQPDADWPIGSAYTLKFERARLLAPEVRLAKYSAAFSTAPFTATIANTEFYQDPQIASDKKFVIGVQFSHPVDAASFERSITLSLFEKLSDTIETKLANPRFTVVYDKLKLNGYIHTDNLQVPAKDGRLAVTIGRELHAARASDGITAALQASAAVPGLNSLKIERLSLDIARDENNEPRQVLLVEASASVLETTMPGSVRAWLLPERHPDATVQAAFEKQRRGRIYEWSSEHLTADILSAAVPLPLATQPGETEHYAVHGFRYQATPGRFVYVQVQRGLKSFGGYVLGDSVSRLMRVPEYPRELSILHAGSLLAMSGSKTLTVFSRNVSAFRVEVGRVLPRQLQTLVTQAGGSFSYPRFEGYAFNDMDITERFSKIVRVAVTAPGESHYEAVDLGSMLATDATDRRGSFLLRVQAWDADKDRPLDGATPEWNNLSDTPLADARLVILTDLGIVGKRGKDSAFEVFVQSIANGEPVAGATVQVIGRNGLDVLNAQTDADGHVHFADFSALRNEREPVMFLAKRGGDSAFLPVSERDRALDFSRFEVGGVEASTDNAALSAYLFSDRGIYRPGEQIRLGALIRSQDWSKGLAGVPLQLEVTDPRGVVVRRETFRPGAASFGEIVHDTKLSAPSGNYTFAISTVRSERRRSLIGSTTVQVRDFQPDRLRMSTVFSSVSSDGWVSPQDLNARMQLDNLFGTPAENRRVSAEMALSPSLPAFRAFPDYQFYDPQYAKEGFTESLADGKTDVSGKATLELSLQRFARATYRVQLTAQGYEADGGRGVSAAASQLVSNMPFLVGYKADGSLDYVTRNAPRSVNVIAIDPAAKRTSVSDLSLQRVEVRYVSVLMRQANGTYKYESRKKEIALLERKQAVAAGGYNLVLATDTPGSFAYLFRDGSGLQLARIDYQVAGDANLTRSLEKNAEMEMTLSRADYAPGAEIEVSLRAPYAGAGLITIERERVYAWKWFRSTTTSSTQRIRLPEGLEGNAYVTVTFVRDAGSAEIYSSPLSYGVKPFSIATDARRNTVTVQAPTTVKPGQELRISYQTDKPGRLVLFAVDEGIVQVARYRTPDPLGHFFQKRALEVRTTQILDLILPEFRQFAATAAPGGDAEGLIARNLNPFRRKGEKPVVYWSGIVAADATARELRYKVPDYFNGTLHVYAVAASDDRVGVYDGRVTVRGDFVLTPTAPLTVTPGDEFDVSVAVANNLPGSGANARLQVALAGGTALEIMGSAAQAVVVGEGHEGTVRFKLRARDQLGSAALKFSVSSGKSGVTRSIDLSVRPVTAYATQLRAGVLPKGTTDVSLDRSLYPQFRVQQAGASTLPLQFAQGFVSYLGNYAYLCTEQLVSQAMPVTLLAARPEFGAVRMTQGAAVEGLVAELRARQNDAGAYRLWPGGDTVAEFASLYAQQWLLEAQQRGLNVPADMISSGNDYLREIAARDGDNLVQERSAAYAIYLLTRQGRAMTAELAALRARLNQRYARDWPQDLTAAFIAATLSLGKQEREAASLMRGMRFGLTPGFEPFYDAMTRDGWMLFFMARYFPAQLTTLAPEVMTRLAQHINSGDYHSLSAGTTLLALDAYATATSAQNAQLSISEIPRAGNTLQALTLPAGTLPRSAVSDAARALRFGNASALTGFYLVEQSGFDRQAPATALRQGLEVQRDYTDAAGKSVSGAVIGQELTVHLKVRGLAQREYGTLALVDLLPGGFELVVPPQDARAGGSEELGSHNFEEATESSGWSCGFCGAGTHASLEYAEMREDRAVFYVNVSTSVSEITYRIKATNVGTYNVPAAYAEAMYDRAVRARSTGGRLAITRP